MINQKNKKGEHFPTLGLVLSGGGARGYAHIGVLKIFHQAGLVFDIICGTSIGGVIGAAYAMGLSPYELEEKVIKLSNIKELLKLIDLTPSRKGLIEGDRVREYLLTIFPDSITFEQLVIPMILNSVDLLSGTEITFQDGELFPVLMATIAVPGLFAPVNIPPYVLIDGGVLNNLPIKQAREHGIDIIVAVDVQLNPSQTSVWSAIPNSSIFPFSLPDFFLEFYIAQLVMIAEMTNQQINIVKPEILIRPEIPPDINMFLGFPRALEIIRAGEKAALDALPSILKLLNK